VGFVGCCWGRAGGGGEEFGGVGGGGGGHSPCYRLSEHWEKQSGGRPKIAKLTAQFMIHYAHTIRYARTVAPRLFCLHHALCSWFCCSLKHLNTNESIPIFTGGEDQKKGVLFQTVTSLIDILAGEALSTMKMILIQAPRHFRRQQVM